MAPHCALFGSLFRKPGSALLPLSPRGRHVSRAALAVPLALALLGWASLVLARLRGSAAPESAAAELPTGCVAGAFFRASHAAPCGLALEPAGRPVRVSLAGEASIVGLHRDFIELECRADHAGLRAGWRRFLGEQGVPRRFHACPPAAERALAAVPAVSERNWGWKDRNGFPTDYPPAPIDCLLEDGSAAGVRPVHVAAGQAAGGRAVAVRCRFPLERWRVTGSPAAAAAEEEGERREEAAFAEPTPAAVDSAADGFRSRLPELGAPTPRAQPSPVDAVAPPGGGGGDAAAAASDHEAPLLLELAPTAAEVR